VKLKIRMKNAELKEMLRWYGRVQRKDNIDGINHCIIMEAEGIRHAGHPRRTWWNDMILKVFVCCKRTELTELKFYITLDAKYVILETFPMEKLNLTQRKHTFTNQKKCTTPQNKHKKN